MTLKIKIMNSKAVIPKYQTEGAVAFDLVSCEIGIWKPVYSDSMVDYAKNIICYECKIDTGIAYEIPEGYSMHVYPRSGWGFNKNIQLSNGTGIIDRDYRGSVHVKLLAFCSEQDLPEIDIGTRIAQAEIIRSDTFEFEVVEELSTTKRGEGRFGSTGEKS